MDKKYRIIIEFLVLQGNSNSVISKQLKNVYGDDAPCLKTIETWAAKVRRGEKVLEDKPRSGRPKRSDLCIPIQNLLDKEPFISAKKISQYLRVPYTTIRRILKEELFYKKFFFRWVPYKLTEELRDKRVKKSKEMLKFLKNSNKYPWGTIITGDESWIYFQNSPSYIWSKEKPNFSPKIKQNFGKKIMISVFFSVNGIQSIIFLPKNQNFNSSFFTDNVLKDLEGNLKVRREKKGLKDIVLHMDNSKVHRSFTSVQKLSSLGIIQMPQPPYSPDISPCDFYLFGKLKEFLRTIQVEDEEILKKEIITFLGKISKMELKSTYNEWIRRLEFVIKNNGDYILK